MFSQPNPTKIRFLWGAFFCISLVRHEELYVGQKGDIPAEALLSRCLNWVASQITIHSVHGSGQIIATSHDLTLNGGLVREIPFISGESRLLKYYALARWMFMEEIPANHLGCIRPCKICKTSDKRIL